MEDISLHILDVALNAIRAKAKRIEINVIEDMERNLLSIEIKDDGEGMDEVTLKRAQDPFFTTKKGRKVGLGLAMLARASKEAEGELRVDSQHGKGTTLLANFKYNHMDRRPLGDINATIAALIAGHPDIHFVYEHKKDNKSVYKLDTEK